MLFIRNPGVITCTSYRIQIIIKISDSHLINFYSGNMPLLSPKKTYYGLHNLINELNKFSEFVFYFRALKKSTV